MSNLNTFDAAIWMNHVQMRFVLPHSVNPHPCDILNNPPPAPHDMKCDWLLDWLALREGKGVISAHGFS